MVQAISRSSISRHSASQREASPYELLRTELLKTLNNNPAEYGLTAQTIQDAHSSNTMSLNGFFQALKKDCSQDRDAINALKTLYANVRAKKEGVRTDNPIYKDFTHVVDLDNSLWIQCAKCLPLYEPNSKQAGSVVNQLVKDKTELYPRVIHDITDAVLNINESNTKDYYAHNWVGNLRYLSSRISNFKEGLLQSDSTSNVKDFYQNNVFVHRAPVQPPLSQPPTLNKDQQKLIQLNPGLFHQDGRGNYIIVPSEGKGNYNHLIFSKTYRLPDGDSRCPKCVSIDDYKSLDQEKLSSLPILDSTDRFVFCTESRGDSLKEGAKLSENTKKTVFIMNPANACTPGGGACDNQPHGAMEENICRNSDLLSSLAHKFNTTEKNKLYLPTATQAIVSTNTYKFENGSETKLNFLSIASPDLKQSKKHTGYHRRQFNTLFKGTDSAMAKEKYKTLMKQYWKTALVATIEHATESTTPVLVATPPGDYLKTDGKKIDSTYVTIAAQSLKKVIDNQKSFQKVQIVFARNTPQTDIFKQVLQPSDSHRDTSTVDVS